MSDNIEAFWEAIGKLTVAEAVSVSEVLRDSSESTGEFDHSNVTEWVFLLNTAREIAEDRSEDANA